MSKVSVPDRDARWIDEQGREAFDQRVARGLYVKMTDDEIEQARREMILASEDTVKRHGLTPRARVLGMAAAGVPPRIMGIGPVPSTKKLLARLNLSIKDFDFIELNEAFASQSLACLRQLGIADDAAHVNPNGGAIALGHPLGMSGARLVMTAVHQLQKTGTRRALATMCVGVGQGVTLAVERA